MLAYLHKAPHLIDLRNIEGDNISSSDGILYGSDVSVVVAPVSQSAITVSSSSFTAPSMAVTMMTVI